MKIYLFNPENGAYLGEDFADEDPFRRGVYIIPGDATMIPPPPVDPGQLPFFIIREQRWEIHPNSAVRQGLSSDKLNGNASSE